MGRITAPGLSAFRFHGVEIALPDEELRAVEVGRLRKGVKLDYAYSSVRVLFEPGAVLDPSNALWAKEPDDIDCEEPSSGPLTQALLTKAGERDGKLLRAITVGQASRCEVMEGDGGFITLTRTATGEGLVTMRVETVERNDLWCSVRATAAKRDDWQISLEEYLHDPTEDAKAKLTEDVGDAELNFIAY
jgi:hypothetical protein